METEGGSQFFETQKREGSLKMYARDHVEVHPQKKKEVLYLVKKKRKKRKEKKTRTTEHYNGYKL